MIYGLQCVVAICIKFPRWVFGGCVANNKRLQNTQGRDVNYFARGRCVFWVPYQEGFLMFLSSLSFGGVPCKWNGRSWKKAWEGRERMGRTRIRHKK